MAGHTIHYDLKEEQGRIIDRTFYIANPDERSVRWPTKCCGTRPGGGPGQDDRHHERHDHDGRFLHARAGGAPVSNPALEITSSAYVSHSAEILYRNAFRGFRPEVARWAHFYTNIHSEGLNRPEDLPNARVFMDRSHWTTYSCQLHLRRQHPAAEKGQPPVLRGQGGL
jgi:phosphoenolpyruvate carboxykinase (GTP)